VGVSELIALVGAWEQGTKPASRAAVDLPGLKAFVEIVTRCDGGRVVAPFPDGGMVLSGHLRHRRH
jgi:hypothetical protein